MSGKLPRARPGNAVDRAVRIRDATPEDADALVAILIASKEASFPDLVDDHDRDVRFWTDRWFGYLTQGSRAQKSRGDGYALVAERAGRPVAFAAFHHTSRHGADVELQAIFVLKEAQNQGVGTGLLRVIAGRLLAEGSRSMCVGYDPRNPYKRFYSKHGALEIDPHWALWENIRELALPVDP